MKQEPKKVTSIRIRPRDKKLIEYHYGTVQNMIDTRIGVLKFHYKKKDEA